MVVSTKCFLQSKAICCLVRVAFSGILQERNSLGDLIISYIYEYLCPSSAKRVPYCLLKLFFLQVGSCVPAVSVGITPPCFFCMKLYSNLQHTFGDVTTLPPRRLCSVSTGGKERQSSRWGTLGRCLRTKDQRGWCFFGRGAKIPFRPCERCRRGRATKK